MFCLAVLVLGGNGRVGGDINTLRHRRLRLERKRGMRGRTMSVRRLTFLIAFMGMNGCHSGGGEFCYIVR